MHATLLELLIEKLARLRGRKLFDLFDIGQKVRDKRRAHLRNRRAPLEVDAHCGFDVALRDGRKVLARFGKLFRAEQLHVNLSIGPLLDIGRESFKQLRHMVRGRHLMRNAHDDWLRHGNAGQ